MPYNWDAANAAIRAERGRRKWSQEELAKRAGVSLGTVKNLEGARDYQRMPVEKLRAIDAAFDWPSGTLEAKLDPETAVPPEDLETRYSRSETTDSGRVVSMVDDMIYRVFMFGAPDATFEQYDQVRRRVFEVLQEAGIDVAEKNKATSSGTDTQP